LAPPQSMKLAGPLQAESSEVNRKFVGEEEVKASRPMRRTWRKALEKRKVPQSEPLQGELRKPRHGALRVVGGEARGRRLESPATMLRPMMSKVREAMFSTLFSMGSFRNRETNVLDAFAGSGAVGCEALSRGAGFVAFVDVSPLACDVATRNARRCGYLPCWDDDHQNAFGRPFAGVVERRSRNDDHANFASNCETVEQALSRDHVRGHKFDVLSLTPPYEEVVYADLLGAVANSTLLNDDAIVVVEYPVELGALPKVYGSRRQLVGLRNRRYGRTVLAFYAFQPTGKVDFDFKLDEFDDKALKKKK